MSSGKQIKIIKIPNELDKQNNRLPPPTKNINDTRMPRMYLELLENKDKIKPNLVNKEYDPDDAESVYSFTQHVDTKKADSKQQLMEAVTENENEEDDDDEFSLNDEGESLIEDEEEEEEEDEEEEEEEGSLVEEEEESIMSEPTVVPQETNETQQKLKEMLFSSREDDAPPTLSELQKRGEVRKDRVVPSFDQLQSQEEEDELKRELLFKFELLKKNYKNVNVPEYSIHSDYKTMQHTYENTLRHMSLESSVDNYKNLLIGAFMLFEFVLGVWLKFDMSGFTQQQILNMNQYERLLIELGEKSYVPEGKQWPVELRLLGLVVMNAVIFIVSKMILQRTGSNLLGMMNSARNRFNEGVTTAKKRKMRGPNIDLSNIPDISEVNDQQEEEDEDSL